MLPTRSRVGFFFEPDLPMPSSEERRSHGSVRCEVVMDTSKSLRLPIPTVLSLEVADLVRIRKWADLNDVIVAVRLDHGIVGEEYEEVVAFHTRSSPLCRLIIWRNAESVFVQPLVGVRGQYGSVRDALASLRLTARCSNRHHRGRSVATGIGKPPRLQQDRSSRHLAIAGLG
jgi:hypothetical protein